MIEVSDSQQSSSTRRLDEPSDSALSADESRQAMLIRVSRLPVAERLELLDRLCREQTRLAIGARRVR
jgi:hypothetical protein